MKKISALLLMLLILCSVSLVSAANITEDYKLLCGNEYFAEDTNKIVLGVTYLGKATNPQEFLLPKQLSNLQVTKVFSQGNQAFLLVPKYENVGLKITQIDAKDKVLYQGISKPVLIFCNDESLPYKIYVEAYKAKSNKKLLNFMLHINRVSLMPMVPKGVLDYTKEFE